MDERAFLISGPVADVAEAMDIETAWPSILPGTHAVVINFSSAPVEALDRLCRELRALHAPDLEYRPTVACMTCRTTWPCATARAVEHHGVITDAR